jgi:hypothetical protein
LESIDWQQLVGDVNLNSANADEKIQNLMNKVYNQQSKDVSFLLSLSHTHNLLHSISL